MPIRKNVIAVIMRPECQVRIRWRRALWRCAIRRRLIGPAVAPRVIGCVGLSGLEPGRHRVEIEVSNQLLK